MKTKNYAKPLRRMTKKQLKRLKKGVYPACAFAESPAILATLELQRRSASKLHRRYVQFSFLSEATL